MISAGAVVAVEMHTNSFSSNGLIQLSNNSKIADTFFSSFSIIDFCRSEWFKDDLLVFVMSLRFTKKTLRYSVVR